MHLRRSFVLTAAAAALLFTACGDDDDTAADDTETTTTTTTEAEAEDETTTTAADDGSEAEGGGEVNPEFADYCAAVAAIDEESAPTVEQLEAIRAVAPGEIDADIEVVVDGFIEAIETGDFDTFFNDPEVQDEFQRIEAFEVENCGETPGGGASD